jgi:hypothetical protein
MKKNQKHYEDMSARELGQATREFDKPFVFERARPMRASERAQERKLRRGRDHLRKGCKKIRAFPFLN